MAFYVVFGAACILGGGFEAISGHVITGLGSAALGVVVSSLFLLARDVEALSRRVAELEHDGGARPQADAVISAPVRGDVSPSPDALAPRTALARAQDLHFAKRFADARAAYRDIVDLYSDTEEARIARQQLDNLRDA